jgi:hypothetical protein
VTYGVAIAERLDIEKSEDFLGFEELEAGNFAWGKTSMVACFG